MEYINYNEYLKNIDYISRTMTQDKEQKEATYYIPDIKPEKTMICNTNNEKNNMPEIKMEMKIVSKDTKIEKILEELLMCNKEPLFYDYLINQAMSDHDKQLLEKINDKKNNHNAILKKLYADMTGKKLDLRNTCIDELYSINEKYLANLHKAFHMEKCELELYKKLLSMLNEPEHKKHYNMILNIIIEKLEILDTLNLLMIQNRK